MDRPLLALLLLLTAALPLRAETVHIGHLTFPTGAQFTGILVDEVPGRSVTVEDALGQRFGYTLGNGTKMWKQWLDVPPQRSPFLSAGLSFLIPGLGQHYNGEHNLGLAIEGVCLGSLLVAGLTGFDVYRQDHTGEQIGVGLFLGSWIFGILQAPFASMVGNDERKEKLFGPDRASSLEFLPNLAQAPGLAARWDF